MITHGRSGPGFVSPGAYDAIDRSAREHGPGPPRPKQEREAMAKKSAIPSPRSKKAGRPPQEIPGIPRVRRRQKTATAAVRKDTTVFQSAQDPRARWPASKPKFRKR
jgi:hypothetical protein